MLKKVVIEGLFGYLTYPIDFSTKDSNVILLHGPNGSGKTTIFEMIKGISNLDFGVFFSTPFTKFTIETYKSSLCISKKDNALIINDEFEIQMIEEIRLLEDVKTKSFMKVTEILEAFGANRVGPREFEYEGEVYYYKELIDLLNKKVVISNIPECVSTFSQELNILYISAERLFDNQLRKVVKHTQILKDIIKNHENKYAILSKDLDAKFPKKIITKSRTLIDEIDSVDIANRLQNLSIKRNQLSSKGILTDDDTNVIPVDEIKSDDIFGNSYLNQFLYYYILDNEEKLDVFNNLLSKIDTYEKIINDYFTNKEIQINKKDGYSFKLTKGLLKEEAVPLKNLSSGEQHILVLFFELIFNADKKRIILIDEPELSLHVSWQINLVDILIDITNLSDDFLVLATHSPSILRNHRDKVLPVGYENETI
ncbi:AAA family ATPase [Niallia sp. FSL R7-0271]|uniref:AAA family ATPase n=1 Tax=Niallia sp. FSL R7-0271 TaxID=2921678 RepID=UPI0030F63DB5